MRAIAAWLILCAAASAAEIEIVRTQHDSIPVYATQSDNPASAFHEAMPHISVIVPTGQTLEINDAEAIDVLVRGAGTALVVRGHLKVRTLTVLDGGRLRMENGSSLTIRDMPIDTTIDPSQYGHGLLVVNGTLEIAGTDWRQSSCPIASEIKAGDTQLVLIQEPRGWRAGDRLVLPDTRQPAVTADLSKFTETAEIATVTGNVVTLAAPVQFDHLGWHASDSSVGLLPEVACLTQPVVIRSENPAGVRGHVFVTAASHQDVEGVALVDMGRTTALPLDSTLRDDQGNLAHIGRNQIGRYAWHHHHLLGQGDRTPEPQFRLEHCSVDGSPKWGIAIHGSHFGCVNDSCVYNAAGCGIVTEDAWVYGNQITNNIVIARQPGSGQRITGRSHRNDPAGDFWHNRGGFGFTSLMNQVTGNRAYCCTESYGVAGVGTVSMYYPKEPGICACSSTGPNSVQIQCKSAIDDRSHARAYPILFDTSGNRAWGGWRGWETWTCNSYPQDVQVTVREKGPGDKTFVVTDRKVLPFFPGMELVHCNQSTEMEDQEETAIYDWRILGDHSQAAAPVVGGEDETFAFNLKGAYRFGVTATDCEFAGHDAAYNLNDDALYTRFVRCKFDCPVINWLPTGRKVNVGGEWIGEWLDCTFAGNPLFADGQYPKYDLQLWQAVDRPTRRSLPPTRYFVRPWHDGKDYQVFHYEQHPTWKKKAPPPEGKAYGDWPVGVWTQQQLIDLGTPIFGDAVPPDAVKWGKFYAAEESCEKTVERLRAKLKELESE